MWNLCYALAARAALEQVTGRIDLARAWASEALPLADQIGEPYRICESYAVMAEVESARGSLDDCLRAQEVSIAHQWAGAPVPAEKGLALGTGLPCLREIRGGGCPPRDGGELSRQGGTLASVVPAHPCRARRGVRLRGG